MGKGLEEGPREEGPRLELETVECPSGVGARTIRLSFDRSMAIVGCKDGSVTAVPLAPLAPGQRILTRLLAGPSSDRKRFGVRALCDLEGGNLLVGRDAGGVDLVRWSTRSLAVDPPVELAFVEDDLGTGQCDEIHGAVSYLGRWGDEKNRLLVSARSSDALLVSFADRETGPRLVIEDRLRGVEALAGIFPLGADDRLLVSRTGALWRHRAGRLESASHLWADHGEEQPSFVYDLSAIKTELGPGRTHGMYLSTAEGVFLLQRGAGESIAVAPVYLPGLGELCLAISHAVRGEHCYLWVSDQAGTAHLFWDRRRFWEQGREPGTPLWRRSGTREGKSQVLRAIASWEPPDGIEAVVAQACRNDLVSIAWYRAPSGGPLGSWPPGRRPLADFLSWGSAADLRDLPKNAGRRWCIEALLADEIEEAGETAEGRQSLRLFLRNPEPHLAMSILDELLAGAGGAERAGEALTLWAHALVGTIHRRLAEPVAEDYLGALRWLRRIERRLATEPAGRARTKLQARIEEVLLQARKWGLFGATHATRENAVAAQLRLTGQESAERELDQLVFAGLIFSRRVNLEAEVEPPASDTLAPWDVAHLRHGDREYLAVAIQRQESGEASQRMASLPGRLSVYSREAGEHAWRRCELPADGDRPERYSRRILLASAGDRAYLLAAPVDGGNRSEITLQLLDGDTEPSRLRVAALVARPAHGEAGSGAASGSDEESVYSLLALDAEADGGRLVVVGLEGRAGRPRLGVLRVGADARLHPLRPASDEDCSLLPSYPETKALRHNPIWALARVPGEPRQLVVGCGDGQVWKLSLEVGAAGPAVPPASRVHVGRLSAPVWALACSRPEPGGPLRVFAGGADGTLLAFQWVGGEEGAADAGAAAERPFATLWATRERGPFSRIHPIRWAEAGSRPGQDAGAVHAILGITRQGRAVLVADQPRVDELRDPDKHQRIGVPGERLGRFFLGCTVFGSAWLSDPSLQAASPDDLLTGLVARVAVATGEGAVRVLTLHYPEFTAPRQERFRQILAELLGNLDGRPREEGGFEVPGYLLRRGDLTYAAEPALTVALVRWVLSAEETTEPWGVRNAIRLPAGGRGPAEQWLPRHLRPLAELDRRWARGEPLGDALRRALASARRTEDLALFREILEVVLRRANHQLFAEARAVEAGGTLPFARRFLEILRVIEGSRGAWLAWSDNLDSRMRIVIAKNLLDGDTLWSLARAVAILRVRPPLDSRAGRSISQAMSARTRQVHDFLDRGDDLLALEALRAANLALARLCRRLAGHRRAADTDWSAAETGENRLDWGAAQGFFAAVGDFAARSAHRNASMEEATMHEVCRAYALGMLACPPAILRLGVWMAEADLPQPLIQQVHDQLALLADLLGLRLCAEHQRLLDIIIGPRAGKAEFDELIFQGEKGPAWRGDVRRVGADNVGLIAVRKPFDDIVLWLHELANRLTDDAAHLDRTLALAARLRAGLTASGDLPASTYEGGEEGRQRLWDQFRHSRQFWLDCLAELRTLILEGLGGLAGASPSPANNDELRPPNIRPDLVLASRELAEWAQRWNRQLQSRRLRFEAFEPVFTLYTEGLALVERAARRFREGAAVQKNVVLGVLGHGLVELLDEHVLELWEIAQAVDPKRTRERDLLELRRIARTSGPRDAAAPGFAVSGPEPPRRSSTAARFADYLLDRARNAETVPSNLRNLQGLLSFSSNGADARLTYGAFFQRFAEDEEERHRTGWTLDAPPAPQLARRIDPRERHFLLLTLGELAQNDWQYGLHGPESADAAPGSAWKTRLGVEAGRIRFELRCRFARGEWLYLKERLSEDLQQPVAPHPNPCYPSHGTGLYLANLAAAAVGWKLRLARQAPAGGEGELRFALERHDPLD